MFHNREEAARKLAPRLTHLRSSHPIVLGLPRGGVPIAAEIARHLNAPLDVIVVRKLGIPYQPEVAMGAIGEGGVEVLDHRLIESAGVSAGQVADVEQKERRVLESRVESLRAIRPRLSLTDRTVIIVDDGIATGATAVVATHIARAQGAKRVVIAAPVAPVQVVNALPADEVVTVETPASFGAVGQYYADFSATTDAEVLEILRTEQLREAHYDSIEEQDDQNLLADWGG